MNNANKINNNNRNLANTKNRNRSEDILLGGDCCDDDESDAQQLFRGGKRSKKSKGHYLQENFDFHGKDDYLDNKKANQLL